MKQHFGVSLFSVGIPAGLIRMLIVLMIMIMMMPSSIADKEFVIYLRRRHFTESLPVWVSSTDTGKSLKEKAKAVFAHANDAYCAAFTLEGVWDEGTMEQFDIEEGQIVNVDYHDCTFRS
ncbi:hypothetical protein niasHT_024757 [Heterodera trifolii]|uniref:Uncharacterized protein n=1 Tax=Heterodera trifolii TaxID=157864 RepID=A0ABD2KNS1_9BILA